MAVQIAFERDATAVYDASGYRITFAISAAALCASVLLAGTGRRESRTDAECAAC